MKITLQLTAFSLFCCLLAGCSGGAAPGQYKTRERPSAVLAPVEAGKEAKAADKGKTTEKSQNSKIDQGTEKNQNSEKKTAPEKK